MRNGSILIIISLYIISIKALRTFPGIGFQVLILVNILKKIIYFLAFYMIIILGFSMIFYILYSTLDSSVYSSFASSFIVIFTNPLGSYGPITDSTSYSTLKSAKIEAHNGISVIF